MSIALFNDDIIVNNILEIIGRKWPWPTLKYCPKIHLEGLRTTTKKHDSPPQGRNVKDIKLTVTHRHSLQHPWSSGPWCDMRCAGSKFYVKIIKFCGELTPPAFLQILQSTWWKFHFSAQLSLKRISLQVKFTKYNTEVSHHRHVCDS